jgi:hypothetical protein
MAVRSISPEVFKLKESCRGDAMKVDQDNRCRSKYVQACITRLVDLDEYGLDWGMLLPPFRPQEQHWCALVGIRSSLHAILVLLPEDIKGLAYTSLTAQLLTAPTCVTTSVLAITVA